MSAQERVKPDDLLEAAWTALSSVSPKSLARLDSLLGRQLDAGSLDLEKMRRLELMLQATARNLRMLRREFHFSSY